MTQIVLNIEDESMVSGLRKILSNLKGVTIASTKTQSKGTLEKAMDDVRKGKVTKVNSIQDLINQLES